jgi:membrane protease YdiL (CAAX protease family)
LLLILILTLGSARLLGFVVFGLAAPLLPLEQPSETTMVSLILVLLTLQTAILLGSVYLVAVWWRGLSWSDLGLRSVPRSWYRKAVLVTLLALALVGGINVILRLIFEDIPTNPQFQIVAPAGFSWYSAIGITVLAGTMVPFGEELVFRGVLYRWMRDRWGVALGAVASALCFSVLHGIPWLVPPIAALGVILALVYEKSGSVWPAVIVHGLYNATVSIALYVALAQGIELQ